MMDEMVISDRWFYLVQLRILSLGADYKFSTQCPSCQHEDKVIFDLREVKVKKAPQADALYRELTLPSGQSVRIKVADGVSDAKIEKMANESNAPTIGLFVRIAEMNGGPVDLADVKQMTMRDRAFIRQAIEEHEGQLDESFEANCPKCGHTYEGEMQLDGRTFFSP
jgi:transcription elongation factor Elf1